MGNCNTAKASTSATSGPDMPSNVPADTANPDAYPLPGKAGQLGNRVGDVHVSDTEWQAKLSPNQYQVLRLKKTEPRNSTKAPLGFDDVFQPGVYFCGSCLAAGVQTPVYTSKMKFDCGCGWPGFWTNVKGNVYEKRDKDGRRCEILCAHCDGHMGHVFRGEGMGLSYGHPTEERHCVNSMSLVFAHTNGVLVQPVYKGAVH